jgi:Protein of unknown function (DUF2370)
LDPLDSHDVSASFAPEDSDDEDEDADENSRLHPPTSTGSPPLSAPTPFEESYSGHRQPVLPRPVTDGVFANLSAKPDPSSPTTSAKCDEPLPSYEAAAADAVPPYWETTIITPGMDSDEVYVDGFPVGNFFAFVWNAMISMSFQFVGFLLTYLLASTHAARNGSRAGLGVILIQYGFYLRSGPDGTMPDGAQLPDPDNLVDGVDNSGPMPNDTLPPDTLPKSEWMSYLLMVIGWFVLIRSVGEYYRVKQLEKAVRATPTAVGAAAPVVAEEEGETAV